MKTKELTSAVLQVLEAVGIPTERMTAHRARRMAQAVMAVGGIKTSTDDARAVTEATDFLTTRDIVEFENTFYGESISSGSYDDIRRKDLKFPLEAGIVISSSALEGQATNNPRRGYALSEPFALLLRTYRSSEWDTALQAFREQTEHLRNHLYAKRDMECVPVTLPTDLVLKLSRGEHNVLQKAIIEQFLPRFGFKAEVLYVGDTSNKFLYKDDNALAELHFFNLAHEELPDIVAYSRERNLLFMIEAVHSAGPMDEIRVAKLKRNLEQCAVEKIFVTAFQDRSVFRRFVAEIAWETEVWIAADPDHMIHFNGYKLLDLHK